MESIPPLDDLIDLPVAVISVSEQLVDRNSEMVGNRGEKGHIRVTDIFLPTGYRLRRDVKHLRQLLLCPTVSAAEFPHTFSELNLHV